MNKYEQSGNRERTRPIALFIEEQRHRHPQIKTQAELSLLEFEIIVVPHIRINDPLIGRKKINVMVLCVGKSKNREWVCRHLEYANVAYSKLPIVLLLENLSHNPHDPRVNMVVPSTNRELVYPIIRNLALKGSA